MTAQQKIEAAPANVYRRLNLARSQFHAAELKKTGKNKFADYSYFELGDFLVPALAIFDEVGLSGVVSFPGGLATMRIVNLDDPTDQIIIESPMGSAALKGCHEVQNIGAVETYQRRYLWAAALELVEHDALDASNGKGGGNEESNLISDADWALLVQLVETTGTDAAKVCKAHNIDSLKEMTRDQWAGLKPILEKRLADKAKEKADA